MWSGHRTRPVVGREAAETRLAQITAQLRALSEEEQRAYEADVVRRVEAAYRGDSSASKTFRYDTQSVLNLPRDVLTLLLAYEAPRSTAVELARVHSSSAVRRIVIAVIGEGLAFRETMVLVRAYHWSLFHPSARLSDSPHGLAVSMAELLRLRPQLLNYAALAFLGRAELQAPEPVTVTAS